KSPQDGVKTKNLQIKNSSIIFLAQLQSLYTDIPATFKLSDSLIIGNTLTFQSAISPSTTTLSITNCTFMNNEYGLRNLVRAESNANIFITNTSFINENVGNEPMISTIYTPGVMTYSIQYYILFIDSSVFNNVSCSGNLFRLS